MFGRQPGTLQQIYVSGGAGFMHDVLEMAGGANVFADVSRESVQPSQETLLTRAPDAILEVKANNPLTPPPDGSRAAHLGGACLNPGSEDRPDLFPPQTT